MTDRELMQQALDVLEDIFGKNKVDVGIITALRERLAQPEQWQGLAADSTIQTVPAQGGLLPESVKWVGLTQDEQNEVFKTFSKSDAYKRDFLNRVASAIETKLKEKNT